MGTLLSFSAVGAGACIVAWCVYLISSAVAYLPATDLTSTDCQCQCLPIFRQ